MRYRNIIIALGFLIILSATPILGFPKSWKEILIIISSLGIVTLAYLAGKVRQ